MYDTICCHSRVFVVGVKYFQHLQPAGAYIVTQGNCYHFGYFPDHEGYSEAINFVDQWWLTYGPEQCHSVLSYFSEHASEWQDMVDSIRDEEERDGALHSTAAQCQLIRL